MKKWLLSLLGIVLFTPLAWAQTYEVDVVQSEIGWGGKKLSGVHSGTIPFKSGSVTLENGKLIAGAFVADMQKMQVTDIKDSGPNAKLLNHLKSDDFFSVAHHPESQFKITSVKVNSPKAMEVTGDLTIKGITHPWTLPVLVSSQGDTVKAMGKGMVDRTKYDVRYGSGKFFQGLGDKLINDEFELSFSVTAKQKSPHKMQGS